MTGKDLFIALGNISPKYYDEAENDTIASSQGHKSLRRPLLIAAVIALTLLLVGCAVIYVLSLERLIVVDHTDEMVSALEDGKSETILDESTETLPEITPGPFVAEKVLSIQGYEGSPAYNALQE